MSRRRKVLPRIIVTRKMMGLCYMGVCAVQDADDDEILSYVNLANECGTTRGWLKVIRNQEDTAYKELLPVTCPDDPGRIHLVIAC